VPIAIMPGGTGYFGAMSMCAHKEVPGLHITIQCISAQVSAASNKCKEVDHRQSGGWVDYPFCPFRVGAEFKACFHAGLTITSATELANEIRQTRWIGRWMIWHVPDFLGMRVPIVG
jgi:hypothetical protein